MTLQGKGFFTFILPECENGNPAAIVAAAREAGLSYVLVKIADGTSPFGFTGTFDHTTPVVEALHTAGIAVWGWHYVYGIDPIGEARTAIRRVLDLKLDGYVVDAEVEYKNRHAAARAFMTELCSSIPRIPLALSSFRYPELHPEFPWDIFLEKCDYHMPQVYWEQSHHAGVQLRESKRQCDNLPYARPYIATGAAYSTRNWAPTPYDIDDFIQTARLLGIESVNFFSWDHCRKFLPDLWRAIAGIGWPAPSQILPADLNAHQPVLPLPDPDLASAYISALNTRQPEAVAALYTPNALIVRGESISEGKTEILAEYSKRVTELPTDITVYPYLASVKDDIVTLVLSAGDYVSLETLVYQNNLIGHHYLFEFTEEDELPEESK